MNGVEAIAELFAGPGARDYLGEAVTIGVHMRQAGALAEAAGASAPLVAAALLHDVGHLDDEAKDPAVTPPAFAHFEPLLAALLRSWASARGR